MALKIDEFNAAADTYARRTVICVALFVVFLFWFGVAALIQKLWLNELVALYGDIAGDAVFASIGVFGLLSIVIVLVLSEFTTRDRRLRCPYCNRFLVATRNIVVATRNCVYCGHRILKDPGNDI